MGLRKKFLIFGRFIIKEVKKGNERNELEIITY